jgi:hypothetical protein
VLRSEEVLTITSMLSVGKIIFYWSKDEEMLPNAVRQCFKFQCRKAGKVATAKPCRFKFQRARGGGLLAFTWLRLCAHPSMELLGIAGNPDDGHRWAPRLHAVRATNCRP